MYKDLTKENIMMYMIDVLGYSEDELYEYGEGVRGLLNDEQQKECIAYCS